MIFYLPGDPIIIVKKMTEEVIHKAIKACAEEYNGYCLKLYAAELDNKTLDVLKDRNIAKWKDLMDLLDKDESTDIENYNLIDFNIDNLEEI